MVVCGCGRLILFLKLKIIVVKRYIFLLILFCVEVVVE